MPVYEWAKIPTTILRHNELSEVSDPGRLLFHCLLIYLWGDDTTGRFTYNEAKRAVGAKRSVHGSLRSLSDKGLIEWVGCSGVHGGDAAVGHAVSSDDTAEATATPRRDVGGVTAKATACTSCEYVIKAYRQWSLGGPAGQDRRAAIKSNQDGRSPSRARPREEKRRETTDRPPAGSGRSVVPDAAPRDARSAARRPEEPGASVVQAVVASTVDPDEPVVIGEIVGQELNRIENAPSGEDENPDWRTVQEDEDRGSTSPHAKRMLAMMRETLKASQQRNPHSAGRDVYLGNPEWKNLEDRREREQRAEKEQLGYTFSGKVPPPPPDPGWQRDPASEVDDE